MTFATAVIRVNIWAKVLLQMYLRLYTVFLLFPNHFPRLPLTSLDRYLSVRTLITVLNLCTHYPEAIPLKQHTAQDVAQALTNVFSNFGFLRTSCRIKGPILCLL